MRTKIHQLELDNEKLRHLLSEAQGHIAEMNRSDNNSPSDIPDFLKEMLGLGIK
jgi:hypothetical protein